MAASETTRRSSDSDAELNEFADTAASDIHDSHDHAAIRHLAAHGGALCTLVEVNGSYARRIGAQLAIAPDGSVAGSLADHCLERELVKQVDLARQERKARVIIYGRGSPIIDFRLPCGSTIHLLVDPSADRGAARSAVQALDKRKTAYLNLPAIGERPVQRTHYIPTLRIVAIGEGAETNALTHISRAYGADVKILPASSSIAHLIDQQIDPWTAIVCLSHDHEWERVTIPWALASRAFYVGAIGGEKARASRQMMLHEVGTARSDIGKLHSPIGCFPSARHPYALALSVLAQIVSFYEALCDG